MREDLSASLKLYYTINLNRNRNRTPIEVSNATECDYGRGDSQPPVMNVKISRRKGMNVLRVNDEHDCCVEWKSNEPRSVAFPYGSKQPKEILRNGVRAHKVIVG